MKLKFLFLSIISTSVLSAYAASDICRHEYGTMYCSAGDISSINHLGNTSLSGTHVTGQVWVIGDFDASNADIGSASLTGNADLTQVIVQSHFNSLGNYHSNHSQLLGVAKITGDTKSNHDLFAGKAEITGDVRLNNTKFKADALFTGKFYAESSEFLAPIKLTSCIAEFYHSSTAQINVGMVRHCVDGAQKIHLKSGTQVRGNIVFEGGNGNVYLSKDSAIIGQVTGGTIVRE